MSDLQVTCARLALGIGICTCSGFVFRSVLRIQFSCLWRQFTPSSGELCPLEMSAVNHFFESWGSNRALDVIVAQPFFGRMFSLRRTFWSIKRLQRNLPRRQSTMALRNFPTQRVPIPAEMKVQLSDTEDRICKLLDDYVRDTQGDPSARTICRIAGGWVRDKVRLLNCVHHDCLNSITTVTWLAKQ